MCSTDCAPPGSSKIVVNVHYLADALEAHLKARAKDFDVRISDERKQLLETGGGMIQAEPMIEADPFLVVNSDNYWVDGPADTLHLLASLWRDEDMDALLLLVPQARAGNHRGPGRLPHDGRRPTGRGARRARSRRSSSPASRWCRSGCCATRPKGHFRPISCGTGRSPKDAASARFTRDFGSTSATPRRSRRPSARLQHG